MTQVRALGPEDDLASMFLQVQPLLPGQRPQKPGASGFSQPCCPGRGLLFGTTCRRGERAPGPANRLEPWLPSSEFGDPDKLRNPSCLNVLFRKIRLRVAPTLAPLSREGSRGPSLLPLSWRPGSSWHVPSPCPDPEKQAAGLRPHTQLPPEWPRSPPHGGVLRLCRDRSRVVRCPLESGLWRLSVRSAVQPSPLAECRGFSSPPRKPGLHSTHSQSPRLPPCRFLSLPCLFPRRVCAWDPTACGPVSTRVLSPPHTRSRCRALCQLLTLAHLHACTHT